MAKREAPFTNTIRKAFVAAGAWAYKIPDSPIHRGEDGLPSIGRNVPIARPFDLVVCDQGRMTAIEVKQIKGYKAFGIGKMQRSQIEHLQLVHEVGGGAYVFLVVWELRKFKHLHIFPWSLFPRDRNMRKAVIQAHPYSDLARWDARAWLTPPPGCSLSHVGTGEYETPGYWCQTHHRLIRDDGAGAPQTCF